MEFHVRAARLGMAHRVLRVRRHVAPAPVHHRTTVSNAPRVPGKNGSYVTIEENGVYLGTNGMIANNNKKMCDSENHLFFNQPGKVVVISSILSSLWSQMHDMQNSKF